MAKQSQSKPFPKSITILGVKIKIKVVKSLWENDVQLHGAYYGDQKLIKIVRQPMMREILLHELLHAALDLSGANNCLDLDQQHEESLVVALTTALWPLIAHNRL